jgi:hypothetical protein
VAADGRAAMFEVSVGRWPLLIRNTCGILSNLAISVTCLQISWEVPSSLSIGLLKCRHTLRYIVKHYLGTFLSYSIYYKDMLKNVDKFVASAIDINNTDMLLDPDSFSQMLSIAC